MEEGLILFDNSIYSIYIPTEKINEKLENIKLIATLMEYNVSKHTEIHGNDVYSYYYFKKNDILINTLVYCFQYNLINECLLNKILIYNNKLNQWYENIGNENDAYLKILDKFILYL